MSQKLQTFCSNGIYFVGTTNEENGYELLAPHLAPDIEDALWDCLWQLNADLYYICAETNERIKATYDSVIGLKKGYTIHSNFGLVDSPMKNSGVDMAAHDFIEEYTLVNVKQNLQAIPISENANSRLFHLTKPIVDNYRKFNIVYVKEDSNDFAYGYDEEYKLWIPLSFVVTSCNEHRVTNYSADITNKIRIASMMIDTFIVNYNEELAVEVEYVSNVKDISLKPPFYSEDGKVTIDGTGLRIMAMRNPDYFNIDSLRDVLFELCKEIMLKRLKDIMFV